MVFATLLPLGVLLYHSVNSGLFRARSLGYITNPNNVLLEWLRMPGDLVFIIGGILPFIVHRVDRGAQLLVRLEHRGTASQPALHRVDRRRRGRPGEPTRCLGLAGSGLRPCSCWLRHGVSTGWPDGRRTRAADWQTGGFTYHADHDAWQCPKDEWLWPTSFDPANRVMRYRARPAVCNTCPVKADCTSSPHGREISRHVDPGRTPKRAGSTAGSPVSSRLWRS